MTEFFKFMLEAIKPLSIEYGLDYKNYKWETKFNTHYTFFEYDFRIDAIHNKIDDNNFSFYVIYY